MDSDSDSVEGNVKIEFFPLPQDQSEEQGNVKTVIFPLPQSPTEEQGNVKVEFFPLSQNPPDDAQANTSKNDELVADENIDWSCVEEKPSGAETNEQGAGDEIQWIRVEEGGEEFDVTEYERKLHENAEQTRNLLSDLCHHTDILAEQQRETLQKLEKEKEHWQHAATEMAKVAELHDAAQLEAKQLEKRVNFIAAPSSDALESSSENIDPRIDWSHIDSIRVGNGVIKEPTCAHVLPNLTVLIVDRQLGLFLFSMNSVLLRKVSDPNWKWPEAATCDSTHIFVSMMLRPDEKSPWKRHLLKFDLNLNYIAKVEGPKWIAEETVTTERLCSASNGNLYMCVDGECFTALYELSFDAKWTELTFKSKQSFVDIQVLAFIDPIVEILVVEKTHGYLYMFSIGRSDIFARRALSVVEKPVALTMDERGQLFVADMRQSKIRQLDTRVVFQPIRDIALLDHAPYVISANKGFLTVTYREKNIVRIHKYTNLK